MPKPWTEVVNLNTFFFLTDCKNVMLHRLKEKEWLEFVLLDEGI